MSYRTKGVFRLSRVAATAMVFGLAPLAAEAADALAYLPVNFSAGTANFDARLRYENVDQDNFEDDAEALTIRARLGYTTGKWNDLDGQLEFEGLSVIGDDDYNSFANGEITYPAIADAKFDEVNQAWVRYSGLPQTMLKYGRQRLVFDNHRIIGNVGWRQNEQTYDAFSLNTLLIPATVLDYAYITNVNSFRVFDFDPTPEGVANDDDLDLKGHYLHAAITAIPKKLLISPYALLLDFDEIPAPPLARMDTKTLGVRLTGALPVDKLTIGYALEYADQQDYEDSDSTVDADYLLAEASLGYGKLKGLVGYEVLSGDGVYSFQTPLATLHAFQGWADQFLVTPATGIEDLYVTLSAGFGNASFAATYHDYQSDEDSIDYGDEVDLLATYQVVKNFVVGAKYAAYSADEFPVAGVPATPIDTDKMWVWAEYKF